MIYDERSKFHVKQNVKGISFNNSNIIATIKRHKSGSITEQLALIDMHMLNT